MRILHLISSFGSGGAERQLSIIAPALSEAGIECHIGYCHDGPNLASVQGSAVQLHPLRVRGNHNPRLFLQILKLIREIKPDVVQTWLLQMDVMGGAAALLARVPLILSERSSASAYPAGIKTFARRKIGQRASAIVANSQGGVDCWASQRAVASIHLIRNCVIPKQLTLADVIDVPPDARLVLFAGRLSAEKNVLLLLEALILVVGTEPDCVVFMFGEGPLKEGLCCKIAEAGMGGRMRLGGYTHDLQAWINRADVCVSISEFEGNPNVVLEAAGQGCPLVLSDIPAHRELFDEASVWFVNHKSVDDVKNVILRVLHEKQARSVKAERARNLVSNYTVKTIVGEYLRVYSSVANLNVCDSEKKKKAT